MERGKHIALRRRQYHAVRAPILVFPPVESWGGRVEVGERDASERCVPVGHADFIRV